MAAILTHELKPAKPVLRAFLQTSYTDERLAMLLAHAQSGKLAWYSCCCFVGVSNADHALKGVCRPGSLGVNHLDFLDQSASHVSLTYHIIASNDADRRRLIIPLIKAEMKRREWAKQKHEQEVEQLLEAVA